MLKEIPDFALPTEEEMYAAGREWYDAASFSFLDRWPEALHALSFPSTRLDLSDADVSALLSLYDEHDPTRLTDIAARLDDLMQWENRFVRLNSRSPKDQTHPAPPITCAGRQAAIWIATSHRTFEDLLRLQSARAPASIWLRDWVYIEPSMELRCFVRDGRLCAATQYNIAEHSPTFQSEAGRKAVWSAADELANRVSAMLGRAEYVLDIFPCNDGEWRVVEINPYGSSDPILFKNYAAVEDEGGFRWVPA